MKEERERYIFGFLYTLLKVWNSEISVFKSALVWYLFWSDQFTNVLNSLNWWINENWQILLSIVKVIGIEKHINNFYN